MDIISDFTFAHLGGALNVKQEEKKVETAFAAAEEEKDINNRSVLLFILFCVSFRHCHTQKSLESKRDERLD